VALTSRSRAVLVLGLIVVAVVASAILMGLGRNGEIPLAEVQVGDFTISLTRSGELRAERSLTVSAPSVGEKLVITNLISEGSFVKKGDPLVQFDPTELYERLKSAKRDLVGAEADLELSRAKSDLRRRELLEEIRKKEIAVRRAEGLSALDLENAQRELELAKTRYDTEARVMEADVVKVEVSIGRARERVAGAERSLKELSVTAPGDGIVVHERVWRSGKQVKVQEGDSPWPMQPIISLPDLSTLYVATDIDEIDISRISIGQRCNLRLEAYPDTSFDGHVRVVGNLARTRHYTGGPNVFDVSIELDDIDPRFRPGMKARVEIIVEVLEDRVFAPIEAVFEKAGGLVVFVERGTSFEQREVEVGARNDTHIVIVSGLEGTERVTLVDPAETGEG
jgi:HlyD family secretion protein